MKSLSLNPILVLALVQFLGPAAQASTFAWIGGGGDGNWSTSANWIPGAPVNDGTADLVFTGSGNTSPMITNPWSVKSITFGPSGGSNPFTIGGNQTITLGSGGITNSDTDTQTFDTPLNITASTSVNGTSGLIVFNMPASLSNTLSVTGNVAFSELNAKSQRINITNSATVSIAKLNELWKLVVDSGAAVSIGDYSKLSDLNVTGGATVSAASNYSVSGNSTTVSVSGKGSSFIQNGSSAFQGAFNVYNGGTFVSGTGSCEITNDSNVYGGSVTILGPVTSTSVNLRINLHDGLLSIVDDLIVRGGNLATTSGVSIQLEGSTGYTKLVQSNCRLITTGTTTIDPQGWLSIEGGYFSTGNLINDDGTLEFLSGTLAITGSNGLKIGGDGPLGSFFSLGTGRNLEVTHTASVLDSAMLEITGGTFTAGTLDNTGSTELTLGSLQVGDIINHPGGGIFVSKTLTTTGTAIENQSGGTITLRDGTGRISGTAALANSGLLTGDGRIDLPVTNQATGELRAEMGQNLKLTEVNGANAGRINLLGGGMEFHQALANSPTGRFQGSGYIFFDGGLVNQGAMSFSGGDTDLFGWISLAGGSGGNARLIASGGATVTLYDDFVHNGSAVGASGGSSLVFFGDVTGSGPFTGTGDIYFEGGFTPGNSPSNVTFQGNVTFGGGLVTSMELGGLSRGTEYDSVQVGGNLALDGTLSLKLINGFQPVDGDQFDLFDWGTLTGMFDVIELPALPDRLQWDTSNLYTTGILTVRAPLPVPSDFTATPQAGFKMRLLWSDTSPVAGGFEVQRSLDGSFITGLQTFSLPAGQTSYIDEDLTPQSTFYYRLRALGDPAPSDFSGGVEASTLDRLQDWRWVHFGNPASEGDGADLNDPDHDGVGNLVEYACNLDPKTPDAHSLTEDGISGMPSVGKAPDGRLRVTFLRRVAASAPSILQDVLFSDDLVVWSAEPDAGTRIDSIDALWERITVTDTEPPSPSRFARIRIVIQ